MPILATFAALACILAMQWIGLPKWRLVAGLFAVALMIAGMDLIAVSALLPKAGTNEGIWPGMIGGALVGIGAGYFVRWGRSLFTRHGG